MMNQTDTDKVNIPDLVKDAQEYLKGRETDLVCLAIEHCPGLLQRYMHAVAQTSWGDVNRQIGRCVKGETEGINDFREYEPMSTLLQTYTKFREE